MPTKSDRFRGALLGLACGDALGTTLEFQPLGSFEPINDMVGGGVFGLNAGEWTDDTSMALCLAQSLIDKGFDPKEQMENYVRWYQEGYLSSNGRCFDIGNTVRDALHQYLEDGNPMAGSSEPMSAGNGSLMRIAPVALYYANHLEQAIYYAGESSKTTHQALEAIDACRYYGALIVLALNGASKAEILDYRMDGLTPKIAEVTNGSYKYKQPPQIRGSGYVVASMEAALWAFYHSTSFEKGALMAANLGDDADTTAAIFGQLAGAYYGENGIPQRWLDKLYGAEMIDEYAKALLKAKS
jgi:ADP-ribosylglycohydrolase